jgi:hypothetical protein
MLRRTALAVTAGAVALGGAALLVPTAADASSPEAVVSAAQHGRRLLTPPERRELRSTGHVTVTRHTPKHGTVTVLVQRGEVTALSPTSISLKSKDGYTHSYVITAATKVREKGQPVQLSDLRVGERAMVVALHGAQGDVARRIGCLRPAG